MDLLSLILEVPILHCWWFVPLMICHVLLLAPLQPRSFGSPMHPGPWYPCRMFWVGYQSGPTDSSGSDHPLCYGSLLHFCVT